MMNMLKRIIVLGVVVLAAVAGVLIASNRSGSAGPPEPVAGPNAQQSFEVTDHNGRPVVCPGGAHLRVTKAQLHAAPPAPGSPAAIGLQRADAARNKHTVSVVNGVTVESVQATPHVHWACGQNGQAVQLQDVGP